MLREFNIILQTSRCRIFISETLIRSMEGGAQEVGRPYPLFSFQYTMYNGDLIQTRTALLCVQTFASGLDFKTCDCFTDIILNNTTVMHNHPCSNSKQ